MSTPLIGPMTLMNRCEIKLVLQEKAARHKNFFADKEPALLVYPVNVPETDESEDSDDLRNKKGLAGSVYRAVIADDGGIQPDESAVDAAVAAFVREYREQLSASASPPSGDGIPCLYAHWDIGWQTAAMTGLPPRFSRGSWWLEPSLDWDAIDALHFEPDNPWLLVAKQTHRALWKYWDEDYWLMPFIHRSPLDYANGLRGTQLFMEMLTAPDRVKRLLDWCVDWQLQAESFIYEGIGVVEGWGTGMMSTWGPDRAVWVNGDPVGLISREMMREFEQPYTGRLFTSTGGGFFHNHTMGLYQVDQVASTPGIHMQNFTKDPNRPTVEEVLAEDKVERERIVDASLTTPIYIKGMAVESVLPILPILREGRFMLEVMCEKGSDVEEIVRMIHGVGKSR